jgi:hypothetical protein
VKTSSFGEREVGFGNTKTHLFQYSTKFGYLWSLDDPVPGKRFRQNYQFLRRADDPVQDHWWAAAITFTNGYYRLVALKPQGPHTPALRSGGFPGNLGNLIRYSWSTNFTGYEAYVAVVPYDGTRARDIAINGTQATVFVPKAGHYSLFSKTDDLGVRKLDYSMSGVGPQISKRYERIVADVELRAGTNTFEIGEGRLVNPIIAPLSNGSDFPADIAAAYRMAGTIGK